MTSDFAFLVSFCFLFSPAPVEIEFAFTTLTQNTTGNWRKTNRCNLSFYSRSPSSYSFCFLFTAQLVPGLWFIMAWCSHDRNTEVFYNIVICIIQYSSSAEKIFFPFVLSCFVIETLNLLVHVACSLSSFLWSEDFRDVLFREQIIWDVPDSWGGFPFFS